MYWNFVTIDGIIGNQADIVLKEKFRNYKNTIVNYERLTLCDACSVGSVTQPT
jgi:hypothetical protein